MTPADGVAPPDATMAATAADLERARGAIELAVRVTDQRNRIAGLAQSGCGRLLFPAVSATAPLEAVIANTAGGLTGGDRFRVRVEAGPGARVVATTQACEKIYRSCGPDAVIEANLVLQRSSVLAWLPQETILFDRSALKRRLRVEMDESATFLAVEAVLLGRKASGESLTRASFRDSWRIRRGSRLVFAEELSFSGELSAVLGGRATLGGASAMATVLLVAPQAEGRVDAARRLIAGDLTSNEAIEVGVSTFDGLCVARMIAQDGASLRIALVPLLKILGGEVPRVWSI
jgi:urease accessory protein